MTRAEPSTAHRPPARAIASVGVFCGARPGHDPRYAHLARDIGRTLALRGVRVVFGGGGVGLMGALADGVLDALRARATGVPARDAQANRDAITGVIPGFMIEKELAHPAVLDMRRVDTMLARKALIADLADAFVVLPGGVGSMDELFEVLTWSQLHLHDKPTGVLNAFGFYDHLIRFLEHATREGFVAPASPGLPLVNDDLEGLLADLAGVPLRR